MSEQQATPAAVQTPAPAVAPIPPAAPAAASAKPEPKPEAKPVKTDDQNPAWLPGRLAEAKKAERNALLNELGFPDLESAKARVAKAKELEDATLTEQQRVQQQLEELKPQAERVTTLEAQLKAMVDAEWEVLPEHTRNAIDAVAQGNIEKRLEHIIVEKAKRDPNAPTPAPVVPASPPTAPPATTSPPGAPPAPAQTQTKWEEFQAIPAEQSVRRGLFYRAHRAAIEASKPAQ